MIEIKTFSMKFEQKQYQEIKPDCLEFKYTLGKVDYEMYSSKTKHYNCSLKDECKNFMSSRCYISREELE